MSFDPAALHRLGGGQRRRARPAGAGFLLRVGAVAGVGAALCDLVLLVVARWAGWDTTVDGIAVQPFGIVTVCVIVGALAGLGAYVAVRVTRRPSSWVLVVGAALFAASLPGVPPAVAALHALAALWVVGWLAAATRGGTHLR